MVKNHGTLQSTPQIETSISIDQGEEREHLLTEIGDLNKSSESLNISKKSLSFQKNRRQSHRAKKYAVPTMANKLRTNLSQKIRLTLKMVEVHRESSNFTLRMSILIWLTFQNSAHNLLIRYSRARDVSEMFYATSAVFNTELIKLVICLYMVLHESGSISAMLRQISAQVIHQPYDTLKVCVPAMIYIVQNNLFYLAASHLDAASFMITSQIKIFTTALFSVVMLRKTLMRTQWFALLILFVGVSLVQMQTGTTSSGDDSQKPFVGLMAVIVACCLSGFAGVYFEKILKGSAPVSIWMRNVQMSIFSIPVSFLGMFMQDGAAIMSNGIYYGYDPVVWVTVFWYGVGGLSVAVCIKYADNIAKNFATSVSIILSTIGSMWLFAFVPSAMFSIGASLVIFSIFLYSSTSMFVNLLKKQTLV